MRRVVKDDILRRDDYTGQYCGVKLEAGKLTIDHLIRMATGGLDEPTNYVVCCEACNQKKADMPLHEFASSVEVQIENLQVHGDPVIDNEALPIQLRILPKKVFDRMREGQLRVSGRSAQKNIEKTYRRELWQTGHGKDLEEEFPNLPGHIRVMIPEIRVIADNEREYLPLLELAKSARTRNLIGDILTRETDVEQVVKSMKEKSAEPAPRKKLEQTWSSFAREIAHRSL